MLGDVEEHLGAGGDKSPGYEGKQLRSWQGQAFGTRGEQAKRDTRGPPGRALASRWAMRLLCPWGWQDGPGVRGPRPGSPHTFGQAFMFLLADFNNFIF